MRLIYIFRLSRWRHLAWIIPTAPRADPPEGEAGPAGPESGTPAEEPPQQGRWSIWGSFLLFILAGLLKIYVDPFGIGTATSQHAQDTLMLAYFSPGYGDPSLYESKVAVALLRDRTLAELAGFEEVSDSLNKELQEAESADRGASDRQSESDDKTGGPAVTWPISMAMHARILDAIMIYRPKAIFIDILFLDERSSDHLKTLRAFLLRHIKHTGWPNADAADKSGPHIYFARSTQPFGDDEPYVIRPDFYRVDCEADEKESDCEDKSALLRAYFNQHLIPVPKDPERGIIRSYPAEVQLWTREASDNPESDAELIPNGFHSLPAFELLDRLAIEREPESTWQASDKRWTGEAWRDLEIVWATRPHSINMKWMRCKCFAGDKECLELRERRGGNESDVETIEDSLPWRFATAVFTPDALKQTCAPLGTVPVEALLNWEADPTAGEMEDEFRRTDEDLEAILQDKVVFYGADVTAAADLIYPPTHDRLAGVYMHAMAMDNLLTYGPDYFFRSGWSRALDTVAIFVLGLLYLRLRLWVGGTGWAPPGQFVFACLYGTLCIALVFVYMLVLTGVFRIAPIDWLGTLGLAFGLVLTWFLQLAGPLWRHIVRAVSRRYAQPAETPTASGT